MFFKKIKQISQPHLQAVLIQHEAGQMIKQTYPMQQFIILVINYVLRVLLLFNLRVICLAELY